MTQIRWNAERKIIKWGTETADRFNPAVLRLTDNAETELEELRIETLAGETGITLIRPSGRSRVRAPLHHYQAHGVRFSTDVHGD